ncbi:phosphoribosylanthranilate isomerase [Hymenobacter sp. BT559]|uniref:phosphoribosylanthranilate isomerase n=1 Tax=Hymenobacter sp. BT559 TaxID=2795729 RepID=UPI0018EC2A73|nr:phosphoribosylanthranilate isomerase [Hymenobacter sp. BT559]MBJ6143627.1 phosphoribosylanthranilate isomerase [Hymenobacter sp. BT559]
MKIKICGMREAANLLAVADFDPDFVGFIFYPKSARYVGDSLDPVQVRSLPTTIAKVGVFVDADLTEVRAINCAYTLDYVQLHGHESPAYCQQAHDAGLHVIKAFAVGDTFDFSALAAYEPSCDFFLFDTKGALPGGNGTAFDWQILAGYTGTTPFLLSGGLGPDNLGALLDFHHPQLVGFDFNSHLEIAPGVKDVAATRGLLQRLHQQSAN